MKRVQLNANGMNLDCGTLNSGQVVRLVSREHSGIMKTIRIENRNQALPAPLQAIYCDRFPGRLRGLMFHPSLVNEEGQLLARRRESRFAASIHMFFVPFDLAIVWINSLHTVVDTAVARSWRSVIVPRQAARYILEIHPCRLNEFKIGDQVEFQHD